MTEKELLAVRQSIVQKLTQARLEKGLSQEQLAKRIGTQRSNICRIEKGTQNLSLDLMLKIAEALDKDVSVMLEERSSTMEKVYSLRLYDDCGNFWHNKVFLFYLRQLSCKNIRPVFCNFLQIRVL